MAQRGVAGSPGTPPQITLAYGESTNRITTSGYTYDLNGNLTAIPSINGTPAITSMAWDKFDRMTSITRGGVTSTYGYDAFGRRVRRSVGSSHRIFFYDISGRLLAEYDSFYSTAPPSRINRYFAGQRLGQYTDRLGSVRVAGGASSQYYPYGEEITSTSNDRYKFAQLYRDSDTGLDYAMARYYAPAIGRMLTTDPYPGSMRAMAPQSLNRYHYSGNDPINAVDANGRSCYSVNTGWWDDPSWEVVCSVLGNSSGSGHSTNGDPLMIDTANIQAGGTDPAAANANIALTNFVNNTFSDNCKAFIGSTLATTVASLQTIASFASVLDATSVNSAVGAAAFPHDPAYAADFQATADVASGHSGTTMAEYFAVKPATQAIGQFKGSTIYYNPAAFRDFGTGWAMLTMFHETLHLAGISDQKLRDAFGISNETWRSRGTVSITDKLLQECGLR